MEPPGPAFSQSDDNKFKYPKLSQDTIDLKDYDIEHEVCGIDIYITTDLPNGHNAKAHAEFYNDATGELLWSGDHIIPQPSSQGYNEFDWYRIAFWIGKCSWEIAGPMKLRIKTTVSGSPLPTTTNVSYITIIDTGLPAPECSTGTYRCNPVHDNIIQKCVNGEWMNYQTCAYGCNPDTGECNPAPECTDGNYRCSPTDTNVRQKCINGKWTDWETCAGGCSPERGECIMGIPEEPVPDNILDLIKGVLSDILFHGFTIQDALVKWGVMAYWIGTIFNTVIDLLSVNVAPAGEPPIRIMIPGGSFITKRVSQVSAGAADDVVRLLIDEGAEKLTAKLASSPTKMATMFAAMPEESMIKLFKGLGSSPIGRIAIANVMKIISADTAEAMIKSVAKAELPEIAAEAVYKDVGKTIGSKLFTKAGRSKLWGMITDNWKWWMGGLAGLMSFGTFGPWATKEAVWEAVLYPISDLMRDDKWEDAGKALLRAEAAVSFYRNIVNSIGWLNPISRIIFTRGIDEAQANTALWRQQIEAKIGPIVEPGEVVTDYGVIAVYTYPAGADIYLDDVLQAVKSNANIETLMGTHNIKVNLTGYHPVTSEAFVLTNQTTFLTINLTPLEQELPPESGIIPPYTEPGLPPEGPVQPAEEVVIPLTPIPAQPNAWKVTIKATDADTGEEIFAAILINGEFMNHATPYFFYFEPEADYLIQLRKSGYIQGELAYRTKPLPVV